MSTELSTGKGYHLSEWTLYQAWQTGEDEITCIGFQRTDAVYYYMDMAMARVYKLSLKEFKEQVTDDELADILKEKGYPIARRTVAKYRQQLNIPVARLRK